MQYGLNLNRNSHRPLKHKSKFNYKVTISIYRHLQDLRILRSADSNFRFIDDVCVVLNLNLRKFIYKFPNRSSPLVFVNANFCPNAESVG